MLATAAVAVVASMRAWFEATEQLSWQLVLYRSAHGHACVLW